MIEVRISPFSEMGCLIFSYIRVQFRHSARTVSILKTMLLKRESQCNRNPSKPALLAPLNPVFVKVVVACIRFHAALLAGPA
ncbi:hypothetical protein, partial [Phaeobacter sp. SYSU ZJ3003]|uniref:hypothetical protein n=1 Tax=Phaeobacter sp. SYSU ZJ3003 TaxID=2109330 RepID=UPI00351C11A8